MPTTVKVAGRGEITFDDNVSDAEIQQIVQKEFPATGEDVTNQQASNPASAELMNRDDYVRMLEYKRDNPVSWGTLAINAAVGLADIAGETIKEIGGATRDAFNAPAPKGSISQLGVADLSRLNPVGEAAARGAYAGFNQLAGMALDMMSWNDDDLISYPQYLSANNLSDSAENKQKHELELNKQFEEFKRSQFAKAQTKDILEKSPLPATSEAVSLFAQPEFGIGALMGMGAKLRVGRAAAEAGSVVGEATQKLGKGLTTLSEMPKKLAVATAEELTGNPRVASRVGSAVNTGTTGAVIAGMGGFAIPGVYEASKLITATKIAGEVLDVVGEVTKKISESAKAGTGRIGAFEALSQDLGASSSARTIGKIATLGGVDSITPYMSAALQGAAGGAVVGGTLGFLADGGEGMAAGVGMGLTLGAGGGLAGRGLQVASGAQRRSQIINDATKGVLNLSEASKGNATKLFDSLIRRDGQEAVAELIDTTKWLNGAVKFEYITNEQAKSMPEAIGVGFEGITVAPKKGDVGTPTVFINIDRVNPGTGFHEGFHGAMRTALGDVYAPKFNELISKSFSQKEIDDFVSGYINRAEDPAVKNVLKSYLEKKGNLPEEIGAEYFRQFLQQKENRDILLRGQRTTSGALINATKSAIDFSLNRLGVTQESYKTGYKGMDRLVTELIGARTAINKSIAKNGVPLAEVPLMKMPAEEVAVWAKAQGQSDVLLKDDAGNVIGVKTEDQVNLQRDLANTKAAADLADVPRGKNNLTDAELAVYQKYLPPEHFARLVYIVDAIKTGKVINGDYFPATSKEGETSVYASRGMTTRDFVPYGIKVSKAGAISVMGLDMTQLRARFDDYMSRPGVDKLWDGNRDAALRDVQLYAENLSKGDAAVPSEQLFGKNKRDVIYKIFGFAPTKAILKSGGLVNPSSLGTNVRAESSAGPMQIGKPIDAYSNDTRLTTSFRLDRLGRVSDIGQSFQFNEGGSYKLSQVNFQVAEKIGSGEVWRSKDDQYKIIVKGNKHIVYNGNDKIGIFGNLADASSFIHKADAKANKIATSLPRRNVAGSQDVSYDNQGNIKFRNKEPKDWTPEDFADYGKGFGVENLGPLSDVKEIAKGVAGNTARVPGGLDGKFTYYDLLWLKANPVNVKSLPETTHGQLTAKLARTMEPAAGDKVSAFNGIVFGMLSPNAPLLPNEIGQARLRFGSIEEIKKFADLYPENPTKENLVKLNQQLKEKLGFTAAGKGGLGIPITADLSNIVNAARLFSKNSDFFVKQPNESWANFVDKLTTQVSGFGTKTGSFGSVWQDPLNASISAMDRHMSRIFGQELMGDPQLRQRFEGIVVDRFNKLLSDSKNVSSSFAKKINSASSDKIKADLIKEQNKELAKLPDPTATKAKSIDDVLGQAEVYGADRVREFVNEAVFAAMGSRKAKLVTAKGEISASAPEHIRNVKWIETPADFQVMSDAYRSALEINERRAKDLGISVFPAQWTLWDRIRQRVEPHEAMFPGLEKLPALNDKQLAEAYAANKAAGYMSTPKSGKQWNRKDVESPSQLAYFMPADSAAPNTPEFKKWFGESKAVDINGKPQIYYHGTDSEFNAFDKKKRKEGMYGKAFFFSEDPKEAAGYGKRVIPVYLQADQLFKGRPLPSKINYDKSIAYQRGKSVWVFEPTQIKKVGNLRPDPTNPNINFMPSDSNYLAAANSGDTKAAQQMVDQAAKAAGYNIGPVYHGTSTGGFNVFDKGMRGKQSRVSRGAFAFTTNKDVADSYSHWLGDKSVGLDAGIRIANNAMRKYDNDTATKKYFESQGYNIVDDGFLPEFISGAVDDIESFSSDLVQYSRDLEKINPELSASFIEAKNAFKGVKAKPEIKEVYLRIPDNAKVFEATRKTLADKLQNFNAERDPSKAAVVNLPDGEKIYYVADSEVIKSADPITRDDAGNIIPLSQRFKGSNDIRFMPETRVSGQQGSDTTQIATTVKTYGKAAGLFPKNTRILDVGAGLGLGADEMRKNGHSVDTVEPLSARWSSSTPRTFETIDQATEKYPGIVNFSVLNVVEPKLRDQIVDGIGQRLADGGTAYITARTRSDVEGAKNKRPANEAGGYWIKKSGGDVYQKGFSTPELVGYVQTRLGDQFKVKPASGLSGAAIEIKKFMPAMQFSAAENLPNGKVWRGEDGYAIIQKEGGKFRVHSPIGLIGIAASYEAAEKMANKRNTR